MCQFLFRTGGELVYVCSRRPQGLNAREYASLTRSEVKYVRNIDVVETRKRADELAKDYRELDARIQEFNWQTELI